LTLSNSAPKTRFNRPITVAAILLAMFMSAMEATVVATAMPTVVADLHGIELYGWVGAIYMLAVTVTIPTWGKLADVWGRKPVLLVGLALFLAGSMGSGFAGSMNLLIAMRAIQGLGAGAMQPITLTIVGDIFTIEERARIQGVFGAVWGFSAMVGPLAGGLIVAALSWRWVFFINVPVGVLSALLLVLFYVESDRERGPRKPLDILGALLLSAAIVMLLLGVGGRASTITLPLCAVLAALFIFVERRADDPILPLGVLKRQPASRRCSSDGRLRAHYRGACCRELVSARSCDSASCSLGSDPSRSISASTKGSGRFDSLRSSWVREWAWRIRPSSSRCRRACHIGSEAWLRPRRCSRDPSAEQS
jgi:hypothetical protein